MEKIKKGDIVARKSHNMDILFFVENIIKNIKHIKNNQVLKHEFSITIIVDVINKLNIVTK